MRTTMQRLNEEAKLNENVDNQNFLLFEIVIIIIFVPLMLGQVYLTLDYFVYIVGQVDLYPYFFVTVKLTPTYYAADLVPSREKTYPLFNETYISTCPEGYSWDRLLQLNKIHNVAPVNITNKLKIPDPNFKNTTLNTEYLGFSFFEVDISKPPLDLNHYQSIVFNTGINFNFWKGKRYCRKKIFMDVDFQLLQIIDGDKNCKAHYPSYYVDDCGTYYNDLYRICAIRNYAYDDKNNPYSSNEYLLQGSDNICPITQLEYLKVQGTNENLILPTIRNEPNWKTQVKDDRFFIVYFDWIKFRNYIKNPPADYNMQLLYKSGKELFVNANQTFGLFDSFNIEIDDDDFMNFYNYSQGINYYYKDFMNGTNNKFYKLYTSEPVKIILTLYVFRSIKSNCYHNVFKTRGESRLLGLSSQLNVTDLFNFALTVAVWTLASIFLGFFTGYNIRLNIIIMKLKGNLNLNNRKSEEITKWTNKLLWFMVLMVKLGVFAQMYGITSNQITIVDDFINYECYPDANNTLQDFKSFLEMCKSKGTNILIFLIIEIICEALVCIGYLYISLQIKKKEIQNIRALEKMFSRDQTR